MALGILQIIFMVLAVLALVGQFLLYKGSKNDSINQWVFLFNTLLSMGISFFIYSGLPSNFLGQKALAAGWGLLAIVAFLLKWQLPQTLSLSKILLTVSIIGGLIHLFI